MLNSYSHDCTMMILTHAFLRCLTEPRKYHFWSAYDLNYVHSMCLINANDFFLCFAGTCWSSSRRSACLELILGCPRLVIQILRGHPDRPSPQRHPSRPKDQLDLWSRAEASRIAWSYIFRKELTRPWQGLPFHPDHWWIASCRLAPPQSSPLAPQTLNIYLILNSALFYCIFSILHRHLLIKYVYWKYTVRQLFEKVKSICFYSTHSFGIGTFILG